MRRRSLVQWLTGSDATNGPATATSEKSYSKDDLRKENEQLFTEADYLSREFKRLKQAVEQLTRDYEESKDSDPVRRYEKLKGMIKRTILHFKLNPEATEQNVQYGIGSLAIGCRDVSQHTEALKRNEEKYSDMTKEELVEENAQLNLQIKEHKRKCSIIRDLIDNLEKGYESAKRYVMMQRYRVMKVLIKTVIHDQLI